MPKILVTGGTGLVGSALVEKLIASGHFVTVLTRDAANRIPREGLQFAEWDPEKGTVDVDAVCKSHAIMHLAGAGVVDKKWTPAYRKKIRDSRVDSANLLLKTLRENQHTVKTFISASATGWYGADAKKKPAFTETDPPANDFLGTICREWEEAAMGGVKDGLRVCCLRTGIVLTKAGGAYAEFRKPLSFGIAAILGSGEQLVSWIAREDLCELYEFALREQTMSGSFNAVAPVPVTNKTLTLEIAKAVRGKFFLPLHVPAFVLNIMMGARSIEVLKSTTVSSAKVENAGFRFEYPEIGAAVAAIEIV